MAEPTIRDPDASAGDRARWVVGDLGWVAGGLGGIAAVVLGLLALFGVVGGATALWALAVTVAGLAVGQVAHRDAAPPVLRRSDLVVVVEESEAKAAAGPVGDIVAAHNDLADALLAGVTALPTTQADQEAALLACPRLTELLGPERLGAFLAVRRADAGWAAERETEDVLAAWRFRY